MDYRRKIFFGRLQDQAETPPTPRVSQQLRARLNTLLENEPEAAEPETLPEVAPLSVYCGYHEDDPPEGLARKTCDRIWALIDAGKLKPQAETSENAALHIARETLPSETVEEPSQTTPPADTTTPAASPESRLRRKIHVFAAETTVSTETAVSTETESSAVLATTFTAALTTETAGGANVAPESAPPLPLKEVIRNILTEDGVVATQSASPSVTQVQGNVLDAATPEAAVSRETPLPKSTRRRTLDILASLAIGFLIALIAYPLLHYAKDRVVAVVYQEVVRDMTKGTNYLNELQNKMTAAETKESYHGFDPQKATWHAVNSGSPIILGQTPSESRPLLTENSFATILPVSTSFTVTPGPDSEVFPGRIQQAGFQGFLTHEGDMAGFASTSDSLLSPEVPGFATTGTPLIFLAESPHLSEIRASGIPQNWLDLFHGENKHLVACPGPPEVIRGQNLWVDGNRVFFRHYPTQDRDITAEYHRPVRTPRSPRVHGLIPVQAVGQLPSAP